MPIPFPGMDPYLGYGVDPPAPPLSPENLAWVDELLRSKGLRGAIQSP
jgi:hypothetical protein